MSAHGRRSFYSFVTSTKKPDFWYQAKPAVPQPCRETLGRCLQLREPQRPHLGNGDDEGLPLGLRRE